MFFEDWRDSLALPTLKVKKMAGCSQSNFVGESGVNLRIYPSKSAWCVSCFTRTARMLQLRMHAVTASCFDHYRPACRIRWWASSWWSWPLSCLRTTPYGWWSWWAPFSLITAIYVRLRVTACASSLSSRLSLQIMPCTTSSCLGTMHLLCQLQLEQCCSVPLVSWTSECQQLQNKYVCRDFRLSNTPCFYITVSSISYSYSMQCQRDCFMQRFCKYACQGHIRMKRL